MQYNRPPYSTSYDLSSLGVYDPNTVAMSGLFDTIKSVGKGVASTVKGAAKGVVNTVTGSAKKKAKSSVKTVTDAAVKKASATIKSKTGVDVSAKDLKSAAKDISKGNISKGVTNLGTKVASQAVNKYGAQAATQLSQLTNQYTSALNVPQSSTNIGSQTSALTAQSSIPMQQTESSSPAVADQASAVDKEEQGLSTGAMVGIGVGVLGLLGVGGYFLWSAKENKKQSRIEQQQRAAQYENLQAINNPKPKKSKAKTKSKSKAKTRK